MSVRAVLLDLLMATMDSLSTWSLAAGDRALGLRWRDAITARMVDADEYVPYEDLVAAAATELRLPTAAADRLLEAWSTMRPWPDAAAIDRITVPYAFVTNCSAALAAAAVARSGLNPRFTLSAEEAGWYKPRQEIYRLACERIGAPVAETRFIAGAPYDARGASGAGLDAFLVARRNIVDPLPSEISVVTSLEQAIGGI